MALDVRRIIIIAIAPATQRQVCAHNHMTIGIRQSSSIIINHQYYHFQHAIGFHSVIMNPHRTDDYPTHTNPHNAISCKPAASWTSLTPLFPHATWKTIKPALSDHESGRSSATS